MMKDYIEILETKRPAFSASEERIIEKFIAPVCDYRDGFGNYILRIGRAPILWSSHTDTVHPGEGRQKVYSDGEFLSIRQRKSVLGADCGTGIYIMLEMIAAGIEGLYIFHRAEEIGGQGSAWIRDRTPELLDGIEYAIAFDRKGTSDIITSQCGDQCASGEFAESLAKILDLPMKAADGVFTDTANYTDLVGECTNISVGYYDQHTSNERQNIPFLLTLIDRIKNADFSQLTGTRKPGDSDFIGSWGNGWDDWPYPEADDLKKYVTDNPSTVANFLETIGATIEEIEGT